MRTDDVCELLCLDAERGERLRSALPAGSELEAYARAAQGLAEPTRVGLALTLSRGGELCVCDLAWVCGRSDKIVSHHLRQMRQAGIVASRKDGRMVLYRLSETGRLLLERLTRQSAAVAP